MLNRLTALSALLSAAALLLAVPQDASAQDLQITGFTLEALPSDPPGVRLTVRTDTGNPIPPERVQFKAKGRVVRVTFTDIPMVSDLGIKADFEAIGTQRVEKGYAVAETASQCFVRLRFDDDVEVAMRNHRIAPIPGGTVIDFPFGAQLPPLDGAQVAQAEPPASAEPEPPASAEPEPPTSAEPEPPATAQAEPPASAEAPEAEAEPADATPTPPPAQASGPSSFDLDDPFGPLAIMLLGVMLILLLVLVFIWVRSKPQPAAADAAGTPETLAPTDVQLLARYSLNEQSELLVVRVLGEVFIIGHGPLTLLRRLAAEPQSEVWGAVDDVQRKLRELFVQLQQQNPHSDLPPEEIAALVEKLRDP